MKHYYKHLTQWFDQKSIRERIMLLVICAVVIIFVWEISTWQLIRANRNAVQSNIQAAKAEMQTWQMSAEEAINQAAESSSSELYLQYEQLQQSIDILEQKLDVYHTKIISAARLTHIMHDLLNDSPDVRLIQLASRSNNNESYLFNENFEALPQTEPLEELVEQYMTLEIEGHYFAIMDYLARVETLNWQIFWDKFDYQVTEYPLARVKIELHTLRLSN